jgi:hypothetical protein
MATANQMPVTLRNQNTHTNTYTYTRAPTHPYTLLTVILAKLKEQIFPIIQHTFTFQITIKQYGWIGRFLKTGSKSPLFQKF